MHAERGWFEYPRLLSGRFGGQLLLHVLILHCTVGYAVSQDKLFWESSATGSKANLRALHALDDHVIWVCGESTVLHSPDGGSSWIDASPTGYGSLEFRSIFAWDSSKACVASAGQPCVILRTSDGGKSWSEQYRNPSESAFFNSLRFWNDRQGLAFSDPVGQKLTLVQTTDAGITWRELSMEMPTARASEAGFAASNSALLLADGGVVWVGTGGGSSATSRVYRRASWSEAWQIFECPLPSSATSGVFSIASDPSQSGSLVAVGGDYRPGFASEATAVWSTDYGASWRLAEQPPAAFRSAVSYCRSSRQPMFIAVGPTGSDYSLDGNRWTEFSDVGFHAPGRGNRHLFACGADGRFAMLKSPEN